jgi:hypothetical protein
MLLRSRYGAVTRPILARLAPALLALAATVLLGTAAGTDGWRWFESTALLPLTGIAFAAAAGLFACHLALLSVAPRSSFSAGALPAALITGALPGLGMAALLVPLAMGVHAAIRVPALRVAALAGLVGTGAGFVAGWLHSPILHIVASLSMLAAATLQIRRCARPAGNDNDRNEPFTAFWCLPEQPLRATQPARTSSPFAGE